jgi:uncharacterized membrane protein
VELIKTPPEPEAADTKPAPQVNDVSAPTDAPNPAAANDSSVTPAPADNHPEATPEPYHGQAPTPQPVKPPKQPKQHGTGVAIFAAVVIILALGAMFIYAYLHSQNMSLR